MDDQEDVDRVSKCRARIIFPSDALYLKQDEALERNASIREWGLAKNCLIPLSHFQAWSSRKPLVDFQRYIPHVFLYDN